jgi:hypothetical protein
MGEWKDEINKVLDEIKGGLTKRPATGTPSKLGIENSGLKTPPILKDVGTVVGGIGGVAKSALEYGGRNAMKGITAVNLGAADLLDYTTGTKFTPGAGEAYKKAWGVGDETLAVQSVKNTQPVQSPMPNAKEQVMKEIAATRTAPFGVGGQPLPVQETPPEKKNAGYIQNAETGEKIFVPKGVGETNKPEVKSFSDIYREVSSALGDDRAGMKKVALAQATDIYQSQLGLEGQKEASKVAMENVGINKKELELNMNKFKADQDPKSFKNVMDIFEKIPVPKTKEKEYDANLNLIGETEIPDMYAKIEWLKANKIDVPESFVLAISKKYGEKTDTGKQTGTYKGIKAYKQNGKYYDLKTGSEIK